MPLPLAYASQCPKPPQPQGMLYFVSTTKCPTSPAFPSAPCRISPREIMPEPIPVDIVRYTSVEASPCPPKTYSPYAPALQSVSIQTGTPNASAIGSRRKISPACIFGEFTTEPCAKSTGPAVEIPTAPISTPVSSTALSIISTIFAVIQEAFSIPETSKR